MILSLLAVIPMCAEHIFTDMNAFGQYFDIAQIMAEKITFEIEDDAFDIYYGYKGSLDSMVTDHVEPILSSMHINEERKSIEIIMDEVQQKTDFWIRVPQEVLYAEDEKFRVLVDGKNVGYDLMKFPNDYVIGFVISDNTENIEIIGTRVIPEFGSLVVLTMGVSMLGLIYFARNSSFGRHR